LSAGAENPMALFQQMFGAASSDASGYSGDQDYFFCSHLFSFLRVGFFERTIISVYQFTLLGTRFRINSFSNQLTMAGFNAMKAMLFFTIVFKILNHNEKFDIFGCLL